MTTQPPELPAFIQAAIDADIKSGVPGGITAATLNLILSWQNSSYMPVLELGAGAQIAIETPVNTAGGIAIYPVAGSGGAIIQFQTLAEVQAATIPGTIGIIAVLAYATAGDLRGYPMYFERVGSEPTYAAYSISANTNSSTSITNVPNGNYVPGQPISGAGIQPGTTITAWNANTNTLTISAPATATTTGVTLALSLNTVVGLGYIQSADGAWWLLSNETVTPQMFGATATGTGSGPDTSNDAYPAIANMIAYCEAPINVAAMYNGVTMSQKKIYYPSGFYYSKGTITHAYGITVSGADREGRFTWNTVIFFPGGVAGLKNYGRQSYFNNLYLNGPQSIDSTGAFQQVNGIYINAETVLHYMSVGYFSGHGIWVDGNSLQNPDECSLWRCSANDNGLHGFWINGPNGNVCKVQECNSDGNFGCGFLDTSQLGNTYDTCHTNANGANGSGWGGIVSGGLKNQGGFCQYLGQVYSVVPNYATAASTTTPGTNSVVWCLTGYAVSGQPTWTTGLAWLEQYSYASPGLCVFTGCYSEGNQPTAYTGSSLNFSPEMVSQGSGNMDQGESGRCLYSTQWGLTTRTALTALNLPLPEDPEQYGVYVQHGRPTENDNTAGYSIAPFRVVREIGLTGPTGSPIGFVIGLREGINPATLDMIWWGYGTYPYENGAMLLTGQQTAEQFGSGVVQKNVFTFSQIGLATNGRVSGVVNPSIIVDANNSAPSGSDPAGAGWQRWNTAPTPVAPNEWVCIVGGATPTWVANYNCGAVVLAPCTIANLPSASTCQGARGMVTNSSQAASGNFGATLSSSTGTNIVPVYSNGTTWIIG